MCVGFRFPACLCPVIDDTTLVSSAAGRSGLYVCDQGVCQREMEVPYWYVRVLGAVLCRASFARAAAVRSGSGKTVGASAAYE